MTFLEKVYHDLSIISHLLFVISKVCIVNFWGSPLLKGLKLRSVERNVRIYLFVSISFALYSAHLTKK